MPVVGLEPTVNLCKPALVADLKNFSLEILLTFAHTFKAEGTLLETKSFTVLICDDRGEVGYR